MANKAQPKQKALKKTTSKSTSKKKPVKKQVADTLIKKPKPDAAMTKKGAPKKVSAAKPKIKSVLTLKKRKRAAKKIATPKATQKTAKQTTKPKTKKSQTPKPQIKQKQTTRPTPETGSVTKKKASAKKATPKMKKMKQTAPKTQAQKNLAIKNQKKLKALIAKGKREGFLTYEEINDLIPDGKVSAEQIDNTLILLDEMDIKITDKENLPKQIVKLKMTDKKAAKTGQKALPDFGTVTDPVKMYLREMGLVTLLSREGEVEIAKKIEAGEQDVLKSLLETTMGVDYLLKLGEHIKEGELRPKHVLRDIDEGDTLIDEVVQIANFVVTLTEITALNDENTVFRERIVSRQPAGGRTAQNSALYFPQKRQAL